MKRREFLKYAGLAAASPVLKVLAGQRNRIEAAPSPPAEKMKRIGCTTVCFRMRFPSTRPKDQPGRQKDLTLLEAPNFFAESLGVHNVELWSLHFEEKSLDYCKKIRAAAERAGSRIINIQCDEPGYNLSHPDGARRKKDIAFVKEWMDRAAACGATSLRANTGGGPRFEVNVTADSFRQLAEHGQKIGVRILIENHGGHSSDPENIVAIIRAVGSPFCRSLPDFGNVSGGDAARHGLLRMLFPHAHLVSAKGMDFDENLKHVSYDIGACVRIGEESGYRGIYSIEQWSPRPIPRDPVEVTRRIIQLVLESLR